MVGTAVSLVATGTTVQVTRTGTILAAPLFLAYAEDASGRESLPLGKNKANRESVSRPKGSKGVKRKE